jgi:hypothetical protein
MNLQMQKPPMSEFTQTSMMRPGRFGDRMRWWQIAAQAGTRAADN